MLLISILLVVGGTHTNALSISGAVTKANLDTSEVQLHVRQTEPSACTPQLCSDENRGDYECATDPAITTYIFTIDETLRAFTIYRPSTSSTDPMPVLLDMQCYTKSSLRGLGLSHSRTAQSRAATKYGYAHIGLSTPPSGDGNWKMFRDGQLPQFESNPMGCSAEHSHEFLYLHTVMTYIRDQSDLATNQVYTKGQSQNSMFAAYAGFCFHEQVRGVFQGASGMVNRYNGINYGNAQDDNKPQGGTCPCWSTCEDGSCDFFPLYPCYTEEKPMVHCLVTYDSDSFCNETAQPMYDASTAEGHTVSLLIFDTNSANGVNGGHTRLKNNEDWIVGCLGITTPCSNECEDSFKSCVDGASGEYTHTQFQNCMSQMPLDGCSASCAPTFTMLSLSETPISRLGTFGKDEPLSELQHARPSTSICDAAAYPKPNIAEDCITMPVGTPTPSPSFPVATPTPPPSSAPTQISSPTPSPTPLPSPLPTPSPTPSPQQHFTLCGEAPCCADSCSVEFANCVAWKINRRKKTPEQAYKGCMWQLRNEKGRLSKPVFGCDSACGETPLMLSLNPNW